MTVEGVKPDPEKIQGIEQYPAPQNIREVRGFLGLVNFYSKFTNKSAAEMIPLIELTKKRIKGRWGAKEMEAFEKIRALVCRDIMLYHPSRKRQFFLMTDASSRALGAALCQEDKKGGLRMVYLASWTLKGAE